MTIISQNLFRRHRGTRGETTEEHDTARNDSSNDNQESTSNDSGEATLASSSNINNITTSLNRHDVENPLNENNTSINEEEEEENDDEVQELVIRIPSNNIHSNNNEPSIQFPNWTLNEEEINNRREAIRTEIEHMQQSNFIHFAVLCLVPTSLLLIVIAAILSEDGECSGDGLTVCEREPRTFVNAFTTRCICDAVMGSVVLMMKNGDEDSSNP